MNQPRSVHPEAVGLLGADDPPPARLVNESGRSPYVITCDHATNLLPRRLAAHGLAAEELARHIAWDIGALAVATRLSELLDAPLAHTCFSRLVADCNRRPDRPGFAAATSDGVLIPFNQNLSPEERERRRLELFEPYHRMIRALLDARSIAGQPTILLCLHSFTPAMNGVARPWHAGTGDRAHRRTGELLRAALRLEPHLVIGDNQPYVVGPDTDYGVLVHGDDRGLPNVLLEIRQDQIDHAHGVEAWALRLAQALRPIAPAILAP